MAKRNLPAFPIAINIWHAGNSPGNPPDVTCPGELRVDVTDRQFTTTTALSTHTLTRMIYVGKGTDIRAIWPAGHSDIVEAPAGSGRMYTTIDVDDVAKGLPNEFRVACVIPAPGIIPSWPTPYP